MIDVRLLVGGLVAALLATGCTTVDGRPETTATPVSASPTAANAAGDRAAVGKPAPDFRLKSLEGEVVELSRYRGKTVVLEWFNPECPFVKRNHKEGPLKDMAARTGASGVVWLAINSAAPGKQGHGAEVNGRGRDAFGMKYPILVDEDGAVGKRYGAERTPHMYVIDPKGTLVYAGAIDNAPDGDPSEGDKVVNYVESALADLAAGRPVAQAQTKAYGCSVKYP
jgi:peroxiredoxin